MKRMLTIILAITLVFSVASAFAAELTDKELIKAVQQALNDEGYNCGTPDGSIGKNTKNAITSYQTDRGMIVSGTITEELVIALGLSGGFDYTVFNEYSSYKEDKFDKAWSVSSQSVKSDNVHFNVFIAGNTDGSVNNFGLYVYQLEEAEEATMIYPDKVQFLLDDGLVYSFDLMGMNNAFNFTCIYFNQDMLGFIEALNNTNSVQIRLQNAELVNSGISYTDECDVSFTKEEFAPIADMLETCIQQNIFNCFSNDAKMTNAVWAQMGYMRYEVK